MPCLPTARSNLMRRLQLLHMRLWYQMGVSTTSMRRTGTAGMPLVRITLARSLTCLRCEYIFYRGLYRTAYARVSRSTITDTELQIGQFVLPRHGTNVTDDSHDARYMRSHKEDLPEEYVSTRHQLQAAPCAHEHCSGSLWSIILNVVVDVDTSTTSSTR